MRIFVGYECTSTLTRSEANMAADVLRCVVSNSPPAECLVKVPTEGRVMCINYIFIKIPPLNLLIANDIHACLSPATTVCAKTLNARCREMQKYLECH